MLKSFIVGVNSILLPFIYTSIKQELYKLQQYGIDLQEMKLMSISDAIIKVGESMRHNKKILSIAFSIVSIIFIQYLALIYQINKSFRLDKNILTAYSIILMITCISLPVFLIFSYFYNSKFIGNIIMYQINNYWTSSITYLSAMHITSNILYLMIFNMLYYITISKVDT